MLILEVPQRENGFAENRIVIIHVRVPRRSFAATEKSEEYS